jgi:hypothetical protein
MTVQSTSGETRLNTSALFPVSMVSKMSRGLVRGLSFLAVVCVAWIDVRQIAKRNDRSTDMFW